MKFRLFLLIVLTPFFVEATNYYVSENGSDSNDGKSESSPWKTLAKVNAAVERSNKGGYLNPGDKILFKKGDYFVGQLFIWCSGTLDNPIEFGSYGDGELPILTGVGANVGDNNGDAIEVVKITNASHLVMNNIWIKNDRKVDLGWQGSGNKSYGILVKANKWGGVIKGLTFRNMKFTDIFGVDMLDWNGEFTKDYYNAQAFSFDSDADEVDKEVGIDDVLIEDCYFYNLGSSAIKIRHLGDTNNPDDEKGRNLNYVIRNNHFEKLGGDGVVFASVCNGLVENNTFIDLGWGDHKSQTDRYFGRGEGCWIWDSRNIIVQYNKQFRASGFGDTYGAAGHVDFYCKNAIFQYNYSEDTEGGFVEILGDCDNVTFRYNVSVNDGHRANGHHRYSIWISGYVGTDNDPVRSNNCYVYNNTVFLDKTRSLPDIQIFSKNTYIYNNLFYSMDGAKIGAGGVDIDIENGSELLVSNNLFFGDIASAFTDLDNNKIISQNPQFTNPISDNGTISNFNIEANSPAINAGKSFSQLSFPMAGKGIFKDISEYPNVDIYGEEININSVNPNIGASNAYNSNNLSSKEREKDMFTLYPNPVQDDLNINLSSLTKSTISVYDLQGKLVFQNTIKSKENNLRISLPDNISNGIYILKVTQEKKEQSTQFILYR